MVIPCLCSFQLTVPSSASAGTCRGEAPPSASQTVLLLENPTGAFIASLHSATANLL